MKKRNKLIKRIGSVLCAVFVLFSSFSFSKPFLGAEMFDYNGVELPEFTSGIHSYTYIYYDVGSQYYALLNTEVPLVLMSTGSHTGSIERGYYFAFYNLIDNVWTLKNEGYCNKGAYLGLYGDRYVYQWSNYDFFDYRGELIYAYGREDIYNSSLGYLQNVQVNHVFEDVPLGENVAEKYTSRWYYDNLSTTGVDLTSGDYMIRYYQERWIVTGYGADDVVKKSDRYLLGDYIVQNGYIQTYSEDIDSTLAGQGYEEPGVLDLLWNKFVTTHYYFQIVDAKNNQVGGLLHVYLTDDNGKFGVEHIGETLDNEGNFDEGGYKDFIDEDKVTTDDVEQGFNDLENGSNVDFGTVDGVDEFGVTLESFASQVSNVTGGVHALLSSMPPWVLGLLGVSFVLLVVGIIFKIV